MPSITIKHLLFGYFFLSAVFGFSQMNMLKNPSFEDSFVIVSETFDDWYIHFDTERVKVSDATDGIFAAKIQTNRNVGAGFYAELSAAIPSNNLAFEKDKSYTVSFDYKVVTGTITELRTTLLRDNFYLESEEIMSDLIPNGWQTFTYTFTAGYTAAHNFDINLKGATAGAEIIIDNTSIVEKTTNLDREALIALYNATDGPNWTNSWDLSAQMSTWSGITLNTDGRVRYISMESRNLAGEIPNEIGDLSELESLRLNRNKLVGEIPTQIGNLSKLRILNLGENELTGNIPTQLGDLSNLEDLFLYANELQGTIPVSLGLLGTIKKIELFGNQLSGAIPAELGNLAELEILYLNNNDLIGTIPPQIYNLSALKGLNLSLTNITGSISSAIGNLTKLSTLRLSNTQMTGSVPPEIGNLTQLVLLDLFSSNFSGTLPQEIGNLTKLTDLEISNNNFSGNIPSSIGNLTLVKKMSMSRNNFSGNLPPEIGSLSSLEKLNLINNKLEGNLPANLGKLNLIKELWLYENNFSGSIPPEIGNLTQLQVLAINSNNLTGTLPSEIGNMVNLRSADFSNNNITGGIPDEIGNLPELLGFGCDNCRLSGRIPVFSSILTKAIFLRNNNLVFDDLENSIANSTNTTFNISPQSNLDNEEVIKLELGEEINLSVTGLSSTANQFQWRKDRVNLIGETNSTLTVSSASAMKIGIYDCVITNPNILNLELYRNSVTIGLNGVDGESDDDNDGVKSSNDYCPNTSPGVSVNTNGCAQNQLDNDNDGVNNTLDICPETASGETTNTHGCSSNQLSNNDDDKDGVPNDLDLCPNTPPGAIVGGGGCSYQDILLPKPDDFTVKVLSTTCENTNNGELSVRFKVSQTHFVQVTGPNGFSENYTKQNGSSLLITDLAAGTYKVIINSEIGAFTGAPKTEFNLVLETPEAFKSGKVVVDNKKGKLVVSGSKNYELEVNTKKLTYNFSDTGNHELTFELNDGANTILAKTDKDCQGKYEETVLVNSVRVFPNPTAETVLISGLKNTDKATVTVSDMGGAIIKNQIRSIKNTSIDLLISDLPIGVYSIHIKSQEQDVQTKVIKR